MTDTNKDYYKILGVSTSASADEIKSAYRKLAKKYHPDMHAENKKAAEEKFKEMSEAYYVLGDAKRKQEYDLFRQGGGSRARQQSYTHYDPAAGFDFDDLLSHLGFSGQGGGRRARASQADYGQFDDILSQFFGGQGGGRGGRTYTVNLGDQDIDTDVQAEGKIPKSLAQQGGKIDVRLSDGRVLSVKVPPGTTDGTKLRLKNFGHECPHCRKHGDLLLKVRLY